MNKYFSVVGFIDNDYEVLFGSFDRADCVSEIECEKSSWKDQGYKRIKIQSKNTTDVPDRSVYKNIVNNADFSAYVNAKNDGEVFDYILDDLISNCGKDFFINDEKLLKDVDAFIAQKNTVKAKLIEKQEEQKSLYIEVMKNREDYNLDLTIDSINYYAPNDETDYIIAIYHKKMIAVETNFYETDDFIFQGEKTEYSFYVSNNLLMSDY